MNEQHNHGAQSVTQTGHIYNQYGAQALIPLAEAKWVDLVYPFGKKIRPRVCLYCIVYLMVVILFLTITLVTYFGVSPGRTSLDRFICILTMVFVLAIAFVGLVLFVKMEIVDRLGFCAKGALQGYCKDI